MGREHAEKNFASGVEPADLRCRDAVTMNALLKLAEASRQLLERIALASGWLLVIMACVTTFDVVGLTCRWGIQGIVAAGLWLVVLGILSVLLRVIVFLFGRRSPEEVNLQIGHVESDV